MVLVSSVRILTLAALVHASPRSGDPGVELVARISRDWDDSRRLAVDLLRFGDLNPEVDRATMNYGFAVAARIFSFLEGEIGRPEDTFLAIDLTARYFEARGGFGDIARLCRSVPRDDPGKAVEQIRRIRLLLADIVVATHAAGDRCRAGLGGS